MKEKKMHEIDFNLDLRKFDLIDGERKELIYQIDPDSQSIIQKQWHIELWNRNFCGKHLFQLKESELKDDNPKEVFMDDLDSKKRYSSDWMNSCYTHYKEYQGKVNHEKFTEPDNIREFETLTHTMGNYIIFPRHVNSINTERGRYNGRIKDRFDLTLECIRRFYKKEYSPLFDTLKKDSEFFEKFKDSNGKMNFKKYVDFFFLQDLIEDYDENDEDCIDKKIKYFIPSENWEVGDNIPFKTESWFKEYLQNVINFITKRTERMKNELLLS